MWTTEKPTEDGFYWWRLTDQDKPEILHVKRGLIGFYAGFMGDSDWEDLIAIRGSWYSEPIKEPLANEKQA